MSRQPKIYVSCLAAREDDWEHGEWIYANQDVETIKEEIEDMLASSPIEGAKEYEISDYDDFAGLFIKKHQPLSEVSAWAAFIVKHGTVGTAVIQYTDGDMDDSARLIKECYFGAYKSKIDFAKDHLQWAGGLIPEHLQSYVNYKTMTRNLFIYDFFSVKVGRAVHVFSYT